MPPWVTGFWLFVGSAAAGAPACEASEQVEVMTFNAWGLPAPVSRDRKSRFEAISDYLTAEALDLVGLQEVWAGSLGMLRLDGLFTPGVEAGDSGLGLLTTHEVRRGELEPFAASRSLDALKRKGVLHTEVDLPAAGETRVVVTHLQAGASEANGRVRRAQVEQLLASMAGADGPALVMGDFNFYEDNAEDRATRRRLEAAGLRDAAEATGNREGTYVGLEERFDRVFLRDGGGVSLCAAAVEVVRYDDDPRTRDPRFLSDHHPVRVRVGVGGP